VHPGDTQHRMLAHAEGAGELIIGHRGDPGGIGGGIISLQGQFCKILIVFCLFQIRP
jgi:hypothetical protein